MSKTGAIVLITLIIIGVGSFITFLIKVNSSSSNITKVKKPSSPFGASVGICSEANCENPTQPWEKACCNSKG